MIAEILELLETVDCVLRPPLHGVGTGGNLFGQHLVLPLYLFLRVPACVLFFDSGPCPAAPPVTSNCKYQL